MSDSSNSFWQALPALKERQRRTGLLAALVLGLAVLVLVDGLQALMRAGSYHLDIVAGQGTMLSGPIGIDKPRVIDLDRNNLRKSDEILREMPELQTCIGCGACTALCTAGNLTSFNFRKVHTLVRRGEYEGAYEEMNKCMLCGKCRLACPRGINTRGVVMLIKRKLGDF